MLMASGADRQGYGRAVRSALTCDSPESLTVEAPVELCPTPWKARGHGAVPRCVGRCRCSLPGTERQLGARALTTPTRRQRQMSAEGIGNSGHPRRPSSVNRDVQGRTIKNYSCRD